MANNKQFELLEAGKPALEPVEFPKEDVFDYDAKKAKAMERLVKSGKWDWTRLANY